jgi:ribosomal protein L3 glutamine methyltransferase
MNHIPSFATLQDALLWAESAFNQADLYYGHGTDNAWDDAIALTFTTLQLSFDQDETILTRPLTQIEAAQLLALYQQRIERRIPVPYLTNEAWFCQLPFYVDERVIIPRSPIAELIEQQFYPWIDAHQVNSILDLCCGSGCIAIACAYAFSDAKIDAVDLSTDALAVAAINVVQHEVGACVQLIESDLFSAIPQQRYDIIVSNPPYVDAADLANMPDEYQHEPQLALAAGDDGLALVHQILAQAAQYLTEQGILIVEVGNSATALEAAYPQIPFTWLEFERGGAGVFLLTRKQLLEYL